LVNHGDSGYGVTTSGADLLRRLNELGAFAAKWTAAGKAKKK
jgi:hypothetical protein